MKKEEIRKITKKVNNIDMTKKELFQLEDKIDNLLLSDNSNMGLTSLKREVKHTLYECRDCADAKYEYTINKAGEEKESFVDDCGRDTCPYIDYLKNIKPNKFDKLFKT